MLGLIKLAEKGNVSLDDPVYKLIPGFNLSREITLRSLGSQLGGIVREAPLPYRSMCKFTTQELLPAINTLETIYPINTRPGYSNLGFDIRRCVS